MLSRLLALGVVLKSISKIAIAANYVEMYFRYGIPEVDLQVGARRFEIFMSLKNMSRVENSNQLGCNVFFTKAVDSGTC